MKIEIILRELRLFKLSHFLATFYIIVYGVCITNSSHSFQWVLLKPYILFVDIM